jgi:hypothetical protein
MLKMFCDCCGKEIKSNNVGGRVKKKKTINNTDVEIEVMVAIDVEIEVMVAINGTWNDGHICDDCLIEILTDIELSDESE